VSNIAHVRAEKNIPTRIAVGANPVDECQVTRGGFAGISDSGQFREFVDGFVPGIARSGEDLKVFLLSFTIQCLRDIRRAG